MADQLSLPNIAHPDIRGFLRTRTRRKFLGDDRLEQFGIVQPIARLILGYGLLEQLLVAVAVQHTVATRRASGSETTWTSNSMAGKPSPLKCDDRPCKLPTSSARSSSR